MGRNVCDRVEPASKRSTGWRAHCVCAGAAGAPRDFVAYGDCPRGYGAVELYMVVLGGADYGDEYPDLPPGAGAGISHAASEPVDSGRRGSDHADFDINDRALP